METFPCPLSALSAVGSTFPKGALYSDNTAVVWNHMKLPEAQYTYTPNSMTVVVGVCCQNLTWFYQQQWNKATTERLLFHQDEVHTISLLLNSRQNYIV